MTACGFFEARVASPITPSHDGFPPQRPAPLAVDMPRPPLSVAPRAALALLAAGWLVFAVGTRTMMPRLIGAAYDGESFAWLDDQIASHRAHRQATGRPHDRAWYVAWAESYANKATLLASVGALAAGTLLASPAARRRVRRFLFASADPLNLAVLRVAVFGMLLYLLTKEQVLYYAAWPREMYEWPALAGVVFRWLPVTPEVVGPLLSIALATTTLAVVGLFTRTSALVSVVLGWYLLGIPQLSGKINHLHHVLLIGLVVALARCGDSLSLDSLWRAVRRADRGLVAPPRRGVRYGLPIRAAMLVLVTVYFFPGFWKLASNGPQWVFSDNLQNHMFRKWFELEHYTPPIALHEAPLAGPLGALYAVVFELGFPLALLWRPTRLAWAGMGLVFHNLTHLLMKISFVTLQMTYVMFVDWQRVLTALGRWAYGPPMRILYDGNCGLCRRTMGVLVVLDWTRSLKPTSALDRDAVEHAELGFLDDADLVTDMHAAWRDRSGEWRTARGYAAYQALAWRVPLLWLTLPVVYLPPVAAIGRRVYRRVADSRACRVPSGPRAAPPVAEAPAWSWRPLAYAVGGVLVGQCVLGVGRVHKAWPLACYPLFDQLQERVIAWPEFHVRRGAGEPRQLDDDPIRDHLGEARYVPSMERLLETPSNPERTRAILREFAVAWRAAGFEPSAGDTLVVSRATYELLGPGRPEAPIAEEPLFETPWAELESPSGAAVSASPIAVADGGLNDATRTPR